MPFKASFALRSSSVRLSFLRFFCRDLVFVLTLVTRRPFGFSITLVTVFILGL